jgi:hypothetical protein
MLSAPPFAVSPIPLVVSLMPEVAPLTVSPTPLPRLPTPSPTPSKSISVCRDMAKRDQETILGGLTFTDAVDCVANRVRDALGSVTEGIDHATKDATCAEKGVRDGEI